MWYYPVSALTNTVVAVACCIYILLVNKEKHLTKTFSFFSLSFAVWGFGYFFWQISDNPDSALFWCRVLMFGAIFISVSLLHFVLSLIGLAKDKRKVLQFAYSINFFFAIADFTPYFVHSVEHRSYFEFWPTPGFLYHPFLATFMGVLIYTHYLIIKHYKHFPGITQNQVKYLFLGSAIGFFGGVTNYCLWYNIPIPPYGNGIAVFVIFATAFSLKNYLIDFRLAVTRGALFSVIYFFIFAIPITIALYGQSYFERTLGHQWWILFFIIVGTFAYLGQMAYRYLRDKAEDILLEKQRAYQEYITRMAQSIVLYRDKHDVSNAVRDMLLNKMEIERVVFFYFDDREKEFVSLEGGDKKDIRLSWTAHITSLLLECWANPTESEKIIHKSVQPYTDIHNTESLFRQLNAVMFVPCIAGNEVIGFISVGQKKDGSIFTMDDVRALKLLASEAALALKNVQFYQELREHEAYLVQNAKLTSLGELAAGFAHQINNPLQVIVAVKQVLDMQIAETITLLEQQGQEPAITEKLKGWTRNDLAIIQQMSMRITHIIDSICRFTKKTDFDQEEVKRLIQGGLDMIPEKKRELCHVNIVQNIPDTIPPVYVKVIDIEQVIMNLCMNAIEAMEEQGEGTITIQAREASEKGYVAIAIADTGTGIAAEIRERIFDPFFTTKGAQGTGLGLSVVHTIIKDNQGYITCDSEFGKGTTFTVLLPISRKQIT